MKCQICRRKKESLVFQFIETPKKKILRAKEVCKECGEENLLRRGYKKLNGRFIHPSDSGGTYITPGVFGLPMF